MNFEAPAALWGLASLALLVLFSLWRQAAARAVVPSVLLWKKIPERNPPVRALRRPKWRLELLLQALAIAAAVAALAGPFVTTPTPKPRKVAFVFDTSARFRAGGRLEKMKAEAKKLRAEKLAGDEVAVYACAPSPRRLASVDDVAPIDAHADLEPLLAAARQEAEHVIVFTDRPLPGAHSMLFGSDASNVGIVDLTATDDEVFVRLVNHGPPRRASIRLEWGGKKVEEVLDLPAERVWFHKADFRGADEVRVEIDAADPFPMDNAARATRLGPARIPAEVNGRELPLLLHALGAVSGVVLRKGGGDRGDAVVGVGVDERPPAARLSVWLHSPEARFRPERVEVLRHPLTEGLAGRGEELGRGGVGELPPDAREGEPLLLADGKRIAVVRGNVVHLCIDLHPKGWASTPSFPIFWQNVVDLASRGSGGLRVLRTGRPEVVAGELVRGPFGARWTVSASGEFLSYTRGEYVFRGAEGERRAEVNLLDERESDTAGVSRPLDWDPAAPSGREYARRPLAGWAAGLSLALILAAWWIQKRSD